MRISYNKLWKKLIDKDMTKTCLRLETGMATTTLASLGRNEAVSMGVQQGLAIVGIVFIGTGAIVCFGLGLAYLISDDWR